MWNGAIKCANDEFEKKKTKNRNLKKKESETNYDEFQINLVPCYLFVAKASIFVYYLNVLLNFGEVMMRSFVCSFGCNDSVQCSMFSCSVCSPKKHWSDPTACYLLIRNLFCSEFFCFIVLFGRWIHFPGNHLIPLGLCIVRWMCVCGCDP